MPQIRKLPDKKVGRSLSNVASKYGTTLLKSGEKRAFPIPLPRNHWPAFLVEDWWGLWNGPHGSLLIISDVSGLRRLFDLKSEAESFMKRIRAENEERENPTITKAKLEEILMETNSKSMQRSKSKEEQLWALYNAVAKEIRELEANYGLSPISRARVGLAFSEAKRAADEAAKAAVDAPVPAGDDGDDDGDDGSRPVGVTIPVSAPPETSPIGDEGDEDGEVTSEDMEDDE
jgi:hypothetical protein